MEQNLKKLVAEIFYAALKAVDPYNAVRRYTDKIRSLYQNGRFKKLFVIGFGKAAFTMTKAVEDELMDIIDAGVVITKYGHSMSQESRVRSQK